MSAPPAALLGRGVAFPPHVGADGRLAWSDGTTNIREALQLVLLTERGERPRLPEFGAGLSGLLFEPNTVVTRNAVAERIRRAVSEWEPRVRVVAVEVEPDPQDPAGAVATVRYELVATGDVAALTLSIALRG
jgi:phage baseplate assembly protein W